jgi:coenzyme F420 hydrogenase subunit beta
LAVNALEQGFVDGVLSVGCMEETPWIPTARIATSTSEILDQAGSKYVVVPLLEALSRLEDMAGRFLVVGLPCHIYGLRSLMKTLPRWCKKIHCCIGLYCGWNRSVQGFEFLMQRAGIHDLAKVVSFDYRTRQGRLVVETTDEKPLVLLRDGWLFLDVFFSPKRCLVCDDLCNEAADISVGDVWLEEMQGDGQRSLVLVRTGKGQEYVEDALASGSIAKISVVGCKELIESHRKELAFKKQASKIRCRLLGLSSMFENEATWSLRQLFVEAIYVSVAGLWRRKWGRVVIQRMPTSLLRLCARVLLKLLSMVEERR